MLMSTFSKVWVYAEWVKIDFRISSFAGILIVFSKLTLLFYGHLLPPFIFLSIDFTSTLLLGVPLGLIALFAFSGELVKSFRTFRTGGGSPEDYGNGECARKREIRGQRGVE